MPTYSKKENAFQANLISELHELFPKAIILKNDANYVQGIPDILILNGDRWAALECKRSRSEPLQPNQAYYVATMNAMSFAAVIYPENKEEILDALFTALGA
jgi:hypothetical protein